MDIHYVRDWSVWLDLVLLARTVRALLSAPSSLLAPVRWGLVSP